MFPIVHAPLAVRSRYASGVATSRGSTELTNLLLSSPLPSLHELIDSALVGDGDGSEALEIGCGEGRLSLELQLSKPGSRWVCFNKKNWGSGWGSAVGAGAQRGADSGRSDAARMLEMAAAYGIEGAAETNARLPTVEYGDWHALPYGPRRFDLILSQNALNQGKMSAPVAELPSLAHTVARSLRPGGIALLHLLGCCSAHAYVLQNATAASATPQVCGATSPESPPECLPLRLAESAGVAAAYSVFRGARGGRPAEAVTSAATFAAAQAAAARSAASALQSVADGAAATRKVEVLDSVVGRVSDGQGDTCVVSAFFRHGTNLALLMHKSSSTMPHGAGSSDGCSGMAAAGAWPAALDPLLSLAKPAPTSYGHTPRPVAELALAAADHSCFAQCFGNTSIGQSIARAARAATGRPAASDVDGPDQGPGRRDGRRENKRDDSRCPNGCVSTARELRAHFDPASWQAGVLASRHAYAGLHTPAANAAYLTQYLAAVATYLRGRAPPT